MINTVYENKEQIDMTLDTEIILYPYEYWWLQHKALYI